MLPSGPRVFLEIGIGDQKRDNKEQLDWQVTQRFMQSKAQQLGLPQNAQQCSAEQLELAQDVFTSDPGWAKQAKKAVQNFLSLCTGDKGLGKASKKPLHYKGCPMHRIVSGFVCQGGDIVRGDGSGSDSIFGGKFNDEKEGLKLPHDAQGVVAMANSGKNTNACQFYLTLAPAPQCDGKHVVVGRVIDGLEIMTRIEQEAASADGVPRTPVWIIDCGAC